MGGDTFGLTLAEAEGWLLTFQSFLDFLTFYFLLITSTVQLAQNEHLFPAAKSNQAVFLQGKPASGEINTKLRLFLCFSWGADSHIPLVRCWWFDGRQLTQTMCKQIFVTAADLAVAVLFLPLLLLLGRHGQTVEFSLVMSQAAGRQCGPMCLVSYMDQSLNKPALIQ